VVISKDCVNTTIDSAGHIELISDLWKMQQKLFLSRTINDGADRIEAVAKTWHNEGFTDKLCSAYNELVSYADNNANFFLPSFKLSYLQIMGDYIPALTELELDYYEHNYNDPLIKLLMIIFGKEVVVDDEWLELHSELLPHNMAAIPNPYRVGTHDQFLAGLVTAPTIAAVKEAGGFN